MTDKDLVLAFFQSEQANNGLVDIDFCFASPPPRGDEVYSEILDILTAPVVPDPELF